VTESFALSLKGLNWATARDSKEIMIFITAGQGTRVNDTEGRWLTCVLKKTAVSALQPTQLFSSPGGNYIITICGKHGFFPANTSGDDVETCIRTTHADRCPNGSSFVRR
jgi:hypothetical protein